MKKDKSQMSQCRSKFYLQPDYKFVACNGFYILSYILCLLSIVYSLLMTGCVYYNTFYNAKDYYKKAIKPTPPNKGLLDKAIQKCEKIVKYHPHSKYVPDALFLMGKCFIEKEEYEHAERKFNELITYYPKHKLAKESKLELARLYIKKGDYSLARAVLSEAEEKEEITKLLIDAYFFEKDYEATIAAGEEFIARFPKSNLKVEVLTKIGNAYDSLGKFESALKYYEEAIKLEPKNFAVSLARGKILMKLNKYEEAIEKLTSLKEIAKSQEKVELELTIAECYKAMEEFDAALQVLEKIKESPLALYEMGVIYEEKLLDLEKAREYYDEARKASTSQELIQNALVRASRIGKLKEYREKIQDSTQVEALAEAQFLLAELYLLEFKMVDKALVEYEKVVQNFPKSEYAPKSAYSIAWIWEHEKKDTAQAILAYQQVEEKFPETEQAKFAAQAILRLKDTTTEVDTIK